MRPRWFSIGVVVVVGLSGFWWLTTPTRPVAGVVDAQSLKCALPYPVGQPRADPLATIPDDFVPVAAVTCDSWFGDEVAADRTVGFFEHRWEGNFDGAVDLLNRPSTPIWLPGRCGIDDSIAVLDEFWLIDDRGRAIRPGYPVDSCGSPKPGGLAAIKELTLAERVEHRIVLSEDQIFDLTQCRPTYRPPTPGSDMPLDSALPISGVYCRFSATNFAGTSMTTELAVGLTPAPACEMVATEVASRTFRDGFSNQDGLLTVELDGCRRVIADGYAPLQASDELVESLR